MNVSPARLAAFRVLQRVESDRAFSSVLLPQFERELSPQDRGLCHELVLGTLRTQLYLDQVIDHFARGKRLDPEVRTALRLGLYQLYFLDRVPPHSAVDESVSIVQIARKTSAKGFANAILRKAAVDRPSFSYGSDLERISIETSHPIWLLERWARQFGTIETEQLARANNTPPGLAFRKLGHERPINGATPSKYVPECWLIEKVPGDPAGFAIRNDLYFQGEASQLAAAAVPSGKRYLDVCAAPGGKTGFVARRQTPCFTAAGDLHWPRVELLRENLLRQKANAALVQYDAERHLPFAEGQFDTVLVDAPCSGTGTIRHNPEIRYFLNPEDILELSRKQLNILTNASKMVGNGGVVIYSTCSMEREENESIVESFLAQEPGFNSEQPLVSERFLTDGGFARTFPHRDSMDGFFIAALRRK